MGASEYRGARRESGAMLLMSRRNLNQGFAWRNNSWIIRHHGSGQGLLGQWMLAMMPNLVQWLSMNLWVVFRWSCQTLPGANYMRISVSVFLKRSSSGSKECLGLEIETATLVHRTWLPKELNTTFKVIWFFFLLPQAPEECCGSGNISKLLLMFRAWNETRLLYIRCISPDEAWMSISENEVWANNSQS